MSLSARSFVVIAAFVVALAPRSAFAQCGAKRSTCSACHQSGNGSPPSPSKWHEDHAFADVCPVCHGGDGTSNETAVAHAGLHDPLADDSGCVSCHGSDTAALEGTYVALRVADAGTGAASRAPTTPAPARPSMHGERMPNLVLGGIVVVLGGFGTAIFAHDQRRRGRRDRHRSEEERP